MINNKKIGIFDSGIGGATVLKETLKVLPNEDFIYYSDSKNNPYGDKADIEIVQYCNEIVKALIKRECKAIVIACNTATAKASEYLRKKYKDIPIVAIEPPYKMIYDYAYSKATLVMATKGTIESEKFNMLFSKYNNNKTELLACVGLAELIEEGQQKKIEEYLKEHLTKYKNKIENVVLGCTHYPLIKQEISNIIGDVEFFDGSPMVAKHLKEILEDNNMKGNNKGKIEFIDSQGLEKKEKRFFEILNKIK